MTKKLYWESPYEIKFSAKVDSIVEDGIVLDQTLFYPESGNQLSDRGSLKIKEFKFTIDKVTKKGDDIIHHNTAPDKYKIDIGDDVNGKIDWQYRFGLMKAHSSQHVFSAVLKNKYDIDTIRANLNFEEVFLQISQKVDVSQLKEILYEVNTICITNSHNISSKIVPREGVNKITGKIRSNIPNEPQIRLIEIENLDLVCCGGTHVQITTEIGNMFINEFKKGKEIRYYVGNKALTIGSSINIDVLSLMNELNTPIENFRKNVSKRLEALRTTQNQQKDLTIKLIELISESPFTTISNFPLFYIDFNVDLKNINKMLSLFPQDSLLVVNMGNNKIRLLSLSEKIDANELLQKFINKYKGKGGGNPKSAQAELEKTPESLLSEIEQFLRNLD